MQMKCGNCAARIAVALVIVFEFGSCLRSQVADAAYVDNPLCFSANLTGAQEVPSVDTTAVGTATISLNADQTALTVDLSFTGLLGNVMSADIRGPAAPGSDDSVLFHMTDVPSVSSGSITARSFAISPAQITQMRAGLFYFNIDSAAFPAGEIRGQIVTCPPPPTQVIKFFNPGDGRIDPRPGDRIVVYCNFNDSQPNIDVWGIDEQSRGSRLALINLAELVVRGSGGVVRNLGANGEVFAVVDLHNNFYVSWLGSPYETAGPTDFFKTFNCPFKRILAWF